MQRGAAGAVATTQGAPGRRMTLLPLSWTRLPRVNLRPLQNASRRLWARLTRADLRGRKFPRTLPKSPGATSKKSHRIVRGSSQRSCGTSYSPLFLRAHWEICWPSTGYSITFFITHRFPEPPIPNFLPPSLPSMVHLREANRSPCSHLILYGRLRGGYSARGCQHL